MDLEYYTNRPITVKEQWMEQNQFPYIENLPLFIGSNSELAPNTFVVKTSSLDFDYLNVPQKIRLQVFVNFDIVENQDIIISFQQLSSTSNLLYRYELLNGKFYVLERVNGTSIGSGSGGSNVEKLKIIDSETEPMDMKHQNFVILNKNLDAAIQKSEKFLGYNIVSKHIVIDGTDEVELVDAMALMTMNIPAMFYDEVVRNVKYITEIVDTVEVIKGIEFDYGFDKNMFPQDLKRALHGVCTFYSKNVGELIVWGNMQNYASLDADDISKNILNRYRSKNV